MVKRIGILTSGGDSPGMNAAIRAVTRVGINAGLEVFGIYNGYKGMTEGYIEPLTRESVGEIVNRGGTILGSARLPEFKDLDVRQKAVKQLQKRGIEAVVVVGGDGSYRGALALTEMGVNCIGLPGTIDNDITCTDYTIGFQTALETVVECIDKLRDTSNSHHRCSIVEVMGNRCGDLALWSGIACGAEIIVTSETGFDEEEVLGRLRDLDLIKKTRHAIVVISEKITDVDQFAKKVSLNTGFAGRATTLGHIQRGGSPCPFDRLLASQMGEKAVDLLMQGIGGQCIAIRNNKIVAIPTSSQFRWTMLNIGTVDVTGLDFKAYFSYKTNELNLNATTRYSFQRALDHSTPNSQTYGNQIPYIPLHSGSLSLDARWRIWSFSWDTTITGSKWSRTANIPDYYIAPWSISDASISCSVLPELNVGLNLNNLFNTHYQIVQGYPMPGFNAFLTIEYKW